MKIRTRLGLFGAGVTVVGMLAFGLVLTALVASGPSQDQDRALAAAADDAAGELATTPAALLEPGRTPVLVDPATSTESFLIVVTDDGSLVWSSGRVDGAAPVPAAVVVEAVQTGNSIATHRDGEVEVRMAARRVDREDDDTLVVAAAQSTEFVSEQLAGLGLVIWAAMIIALIAASIVSWVVAGRALRPLRRLAETTDTIGRTGDLAQRLPPVRTRDELGHLTSSFNAMLDRLAATTAQLERALASQRRFVADASHELRTPLTTIRANAGFLRAQPEAAVADRHAAVADISAESDRMARLVDDLLTLARADAGQPLERRPVDVAAVAATVREQAVRRSPGAEITVAADGPADVVGDVDALTQLVWILTDNALRHGAPPVEIATARHPGWLTLTVTDHGSGFPEADREHIFERFYQADVARRGDGSGLGLPIARWIAGAHGGTLHATIGPHGGAMFTVALPA